MDRQRVQSAIAATLAPEKETREQAEKALKEMERITGFPQVLLETLKEENVPSNVKQSSAIFLKNNVEKYYGDSNADDGKLEYSIHENDKVFLRNNILSTMVAVPENVQNQLSVITRKMLKVDYQYGKWTDQFNTEVLSYLQNSENNPHMWLAGLLCLSQLVKSFEYAKEDTKTHFVQAMNQFLPVMQSMASTFLENGADDSNLIFLLKTILKTFFALAQYNLPIHLFGPENASAWIEILQKTLSLPVPNFDSETDEESEVLELPVWKAKKWALHISCRLYERYGVPGNVEEQYEQFAKFFMDNASVPLIKKMMELLSQKMNGTWISPRVIQLSLTYMEQGVAQSKTWAVMRGDNFKRLLKDICFPLMCFSEEDAELWEDDPEEYIRCKFDIYEEMTSPKSAAETFVATACKKRKDILNQVMAFAQEFLQNMDKAAPEQIDGIFNLIGTVADQLMKKKPYKGQLDILTKQYFIPLCKSDQSYLRARGLHCIKSFTEAKLKKDTINEIFKITMDILSSVQNNNSDQEMPVQVEAALALSSIASEHQEKASSFMKKNIGQILSNILYLSTKTKNDDLQDVFKTFLEDFEEEVEPHANKLADDITNQFINLAGSISEEDENYDNACLTAVGMLTTLETLMDIVEENETLVKSMEECVVKVIAWILSNKKLDYYEEAFSLLSSITTTHISPQIWSGINMLSQIIQSTGEAGGVEYFVDVMPALHNYITVDSKTFFSNQKYLQDVFSLAKYVLDSPDSGEEAECHALKLLEVLAFQGSHISGICKTSVELAYNRGYNCPEREIQTSEMRTMVNTVLCACLFADQTPDSLQFLDSCGWLNNGLNQWIEDFENIQGIHDRRVAVLLLAKFLDSPEKPAPIINQVNNLLPKCLHLFKGLEIAYEAQANYDAANDSDNENSDEEMSGGENDDDGDNEDAYGRGDIEQLNDDESDNDEEGKNYLKMLENFKFEDQVQEGETLYEDFTTVIDKDGCPFEGWTKDKDGVVEQHDVPDEYVAFQNALSKCSEIDGNFFSALMGGISDEQKSDFESIMEQAKKRANDLKSKSLEKQGGYNFDNSATSIDFNFTA